MLQSITHESPTIASFDGSSFFDKSGNPRPYKLGRDYAMDEMEDLLPMIGVGFNPGTLEAVADYLAIGMDSIQQPLSTPSGGTPVQFLQEWLPGIVEYLTAARKIDEIIGVATIGSWEDEQIVQQFVENTGAAVPYGDTTVVPLTNWNATFVTRSVVNFELGFRVGVKEEARAARMRISTGEQKRKSAMINLEIQRNAVGFYGYNAGNNLTYGFLNDPNLLPYVTVATGSVSSSKLWANKTFLEIQADLLTAFQTLRTQSQDTIEPNKTPLTLALPTNCVDYLAKSSDFGYAGSVWAWLKQFYPNVRVVSAPQLNAANGGSNVFVLFADKVDDTSTDDQRTFIQVVPAKLQLLGVQKLAKGYEEDFSNATAGSLCKRAYAVTRFTGI